MSLFLSACSVFGKNSVETLKYSVIEKNSKIEIRQYEPYIKATTYVEGDNFKSSQNKAFRVLAGYIFGANKKKSKIAMTAPVLQEKENSSQKIAMTAPVLQEKGESGKGMYMSFSMPSKYSMKDLPEPESDKISFAKVPAKLMAVVRFSGTSSEAKIKKNTTELMTALNEINKYKSVSEPVYAGYNPPWTIPYFRRNEVLVEVQSIH